MVATGGFPYAACGRRLNRCVFRTVVLMAAGIPIYVCATASVPVAAALMVVAAGEAERGILICGTGIGMSMAANKVQGIRAAVCHDEFTSRMSRMHNDANVLCMGARLLANHRMADLAAIFLSTAFEGGRHCGRVGKIMVIEKR